MLSTSHCGCQDEQARLTVNTLTRDLSSPTYMRTRWWLHNSPGKQTPCTQHATTLTGICGSFVPLKNESCHDGKTECCRYDSIRCHKWRQKQCRDDYWFLMTLHYKGIKSTSEQTSLMMTSSNENIFRVTGPLWGESTGHRWIPLTETNDAELWCFLWSAPQRMIEQTMETPVIWDAIVLIMTSLQCDICQELYIWTRRIFLKTVALCLICQTVLICKKMSRCNVLVLNTYWQN